MAKVKIGALSLNVATEGDSKAPALVLAHPLGADLTVWDELAPALARKFFVVRFDARGHGGSDVPPGPYSLGDFGADVLALLDALAIGRAHFLGLSMSGAVGQWLAIHASERLDRLVLANTALHFPTPDSWNARIRTARRSDMTGLAAAVIERWLTAGFRTAHPEKTEQIQSVLGKTSAEGYAASCAALRDLDLRDAIRAASPLPALVLTGDVDPSTPPALGEALARALPGARLARLPGAHLACVESREAFLAAVSEFLG
ncbi:3-oxoadipate enol-lactonase [Rhodoblastus sp.]|uniref:3-oxoadipate enol-lactonase n=1 Tax=Rhodoblastus sp. TaxID=1962975 RepID=UPI0035B42B20